MQKFGIRFRIANFILGDRLRNYLAVGVRLPLINAKKCYKFEKMCKSDIDKALRTIDELFEL